MLTSWAAEKGRREEGKKGKKAKKSPTLSPMVASGVVAKAESPLMAWRIPCKVSLTFSGAREAVRGAEGALVTWCAPLPPAIPHWSTTGAWLRSGPISVHALDEAIHTAVRRCPAHPGARHGLKL